MRTWIIAKRVMLELFRDKRTLALMFIAPLLILWMMSVMFSANSDVNVKLATVDVNQTVIKNMKKVDGVSIKQYSSKKDAKEALKDDKIDGVIVQTDNKYTVTYANTDSSKTTLTKQALKNAITTTSISKMSSAMTKLQAAVAKQSQVISQLTGQQTTQTVKASSSSKVKIVNHYDYGDADTGFFAKIAPILVGFITFFLVFLISGMALLKERSSGTLDRLLATPVKRSDIVFGYMLGYGLLALMQAALIAVVGIKILDLEVVGSLFNVVVVDVLLGFVALAFGILMSTFAASEFQMMQFIPIIVMPQVFFSGIIPLDSMASWVQVLGKILPLTYAGDAMSQIIMYGKGLGDIWVDILALLIFLAVLLVANILGLKRYRKV